MEFNLDTHAFLAFTHLGEILPLQVCESAAGFYIGALTTDGEPVSRESREYFPTRQLAEKALKSGNWTQRAEP